MRSVRTSLPTIQLVSQPLIACNVPNAPSVTRTLKTQIQVRRKHGAQLHSPGHCGVRVRYYEAPNRLRQPCKTHHDPLRAHLSRPQCPNPSTAKSPPSQIHQLTIPVIPRPATKLSQFLTVFRPPSSRQEQRPIQHRLQIHSEKKHQWQ
jgi:hypothetical protein